VLDQRFQDRARATPPPIIADMKTRIGVSAKGLEVVTLTAARLFSCTVEANAPRPPVAPSPAASACARGCPPGRCARQFDSARAPPAAESAPPADGGATGYCFECQPEPEQPEYYYVYHSGGSGSTDAADETASITPAELVCLDVGLETSLEDTHTRHIDSVDTCTCQWLAHFGLPCVHLLRLWFYLQLNRVPNGVVHRRWAEREGDAADLFARQDRARRFRLNQSTAASAAIGGPHDPKKALSSQEHYLSMMTKMKVLASAAARDKAMAASVHQMLDAALTQLSDGDLGKKKSRGRKAARTAATEHHEAESAPAAAPTAADDDLAWLDDPVNSIPPIVRNAPESASVRRRVRNVPGTTQRASGNKQAKPSGSGGKKPKGGAGRSKAKKSTSGDDSVGSKRTRTDDGQ